MILFFTLTHGKARIFACAILIAAAFAPVSVAAQACPSFLTTNLAANPNTFYPATQAAANAGTSTITLGPAAYGTTPIGAFDVLLIMQMQGAAFKSVNTTLYGANAVSAGDTASGYLNNAALMAGKMEFVVATSAVPLTGGTLTIQGTLRNSYKNADYSGTSGQYRYQVIRVPLYYDIKLTGTINAPAWNGNAGGVVVLTATDTINMNGNTINALGMGFRGGGGKNYSNVGTGSNTDYMNLSTNKAGGAKGEGIAGTPRFIFASGITTVIDSGAALEGYPGGSQDRGAPGNAGGGATDGAPTINNNNAGGGGGGNGGMGGGGGRSWSSQLYTGGRGGAAFAQATPSILVMGGGGGAGSTDGGTGTPANGLASSGAPGGGIVIIRAGGITGTGTINVNGAPPNTTVLNDGAGGGGAGGSVLIISGNSVPGLTVLANGSAGASNTGAGAPHGPGGGGAGGVIYSTFAIGAVSSASGGAGGTTAGGAFGALAGATGIKQTFTIGQTLPYVTTCNLLLTMQFLSLAAATENGYIAVNWQVANDLNIQQYNVEKSTNGADFTAIGSVAASHSDNYSYKDMLTANRPATVYFRVRAIDINGREYLSSIIEEKLSATGTGLVLSPNPVSNTATISFNAGRTTAVAVRLVNIQGSTVFVKQYPVQKGANTLSICNLQHLPEGIYILQLNDGLSNQSTKLMIRR